MSNTIEGQGSFFQDNPVLQDISDRVAAIVSYAGINPLNLLTAGKSHHFHIRMATLAIEVAIKVSHNIAFVHNADGPVNHGIIIQLATTTDISCDIFAQAINS